MENTDPELIAQEDTIDAPPTIEMTESPNLPELKGPLAQKDKKGTKRTASGVKKEQKPKGEKKPKAPKKEKTQAKKKAKADDTPPTLDCDEELDQEPEASQVLEEIETVGLERTLSEPLASIHDVFVRA